MKKELTDEQFNAQYVRGLDHKPDIGDLIEHLGYPPISSSIGGIGVFHDGEMYYANELIDALWNATIKRDSYVTKKGVEI